MICYLVRHGRDDDTVRGGWSTSPLTEDGVRQAAALSEELKNNSQKYDIRYIYASDLCRTLQTADILAAALELPVIKCPEFRETNNGDLAGMKHELANQKYPGLYWNSLEWEDKYPNGESPKEFYERICAAWDGFTQKLQSADGNVLLVTHQGVINVILHHIAGTVFSNKEKQEKIAHAQLIPLTLESGRWYRI